MKRLNVIITLFSIILGICSCAKHEQHSGRPVNPEERVMAGFTSGLIAAVGTKAENATWADGDQVGIFMKAHGEVLSAGSILEGAGNIQYTAAVSGIFTPASNPIYYPKVRGVDFIAYYPYKNLLAGFLYHVDLYDQLDGIPANHDLLYCDNAVSRTENNPSVKLQFRHVLSKVTLNVVPGTGATAADLENLNISYAGFPTEGDFNLADGTFINLSTGVIALSDLIQNNSLTSFLIPGSGTGRSVIVLTDTMSPTWQIPETLGFEPGKSYIFELRLNKTTRSSDVEPLEATLIEVSDMN